MKYRGKIRMLRGPSFNIRLAQLSYVLLISICFIGSTLLLLNSINSSLSSNPETDPPLVENVTYDEAAARNFNLSIFVSNSIWVFVPLILAGTIIIAYIPTVSNLGISKPQLKSQFSTKRFYLPVRGYTIPFGNYSVRVSRKLTSLKGLFLQELNFTVFLPLDFPEKKRIFDFLVGEKVKYAKNHVLLHKTVDIRNIPLLLVRIRALMGYSEKKNNQAR